jgi:hypothetical protein
MPAAPTSRRYLGNRARGESGPGTVLKVDGEQTDYLDPRNDLRDHSPDGFQWGYGGSGPAQLALALVADATGDDELALRTYQRFKANTVARITGDTWEMTAGGIVAEVESYEEADT